MSAVITETDVFPTSISTPVLGDKRTYPQTVQQALTDLARRTNWLKRSIDGNFTGGPTFVPISQAAAQFSNVPVPYSGRFPGPGNEPIQRAARALLNNIRATREEAAAASAAIQEDLTALEEEVTALSGTVTSVDGTIHATQRAIWGTPTNQLLINIQLSPVLEQYGVNTAPPTGIFAPKLGGATLFWQQIFVDTGSTDQTHLWFTLPYILPGSKIQGLSAYIKGGNGHGAMPTGKPSIILRKQLLGFSSVVYGADDETTNVTDYQQYHSLLATGINATVDAGAQYLIDFIGEGGANSITGLQLLQLHIAVGS